MVETAWLEITTACNMRCPYCYMDATENGTTISLNQYRKIIELLKRLSVHNVVLSGGEPCTHPKICDFIEIAKDNGFKVGITTNGSIANETLFECFRKNDVYLQVSIDSVNPDRYAVTRGVNQLNTVEKNIRSLIDHGIALVLACTLSDANCNYALDVCSFAKEVGIPSVHFGALIPTSRCDKNGLSFKKYYDVVTDLYHYQLKNYMDLRIDIIEEYVRLITDDMKTNELDNLYYCNSMAGKSFQIDSRGNIKQCGMIDSNEQLNYFDSVCDGDLSIEDFICKLNSLTWTVSVNDLALCSACAFKVICRGGCRASALLTSGNLYGRIPYCADIKRFIGEVYNDYANGRLTDYIEFLNLLHITEKRSNNHIIKKLGLN